jgi:hypothetical protein
MALHDNSQSASTQLRANRAPSKRHHKPPVASLSLSLARRATLTATKAKRYATANGMIVKNQQQAWFELRVQKKRYYRNS